MSTRNGDHKGARRPTIKDVAERARVSKTTVSRVLNGKPDVDKQTVELVQRVMDDLGYVPSITAVSLARGESRSIGLIAPALSRPWVLEVPRGVAEAIETTNYSLTLFTSSGGGLGTADVVSQIRNGGIAGLAVMQPPWRSSITDELAALAMPVVYIDDRDGSALPNVRSADESGVKAAIRHLHTLGRRRVAMIAGPVEIGCHRERLAAYRTTCAELNLAMTRDLVCEARDDSHAAGMEAAERLLERGVRFDALFASNDAMALGAMKVLRQHEMRVPEDIAVVGFDDVPAARFVDPSLTTIYNPLYEMGGRAASMLLDAIDGEPIPHEPTLMPTHLIVRASTAGADAHPVEVDPELRSWTGS